MTGACLLHGASERAGVATATPGSVQMAGRTQVSDRGAHIPWTVWIAHPVDKVPHKIARLG